MGLQTTGYLLCSIANKVACLSVQTVDSSTIRLKRILCPAAPESVYGLETIEDVFQRFEPTVDLCHVDAEGNEIKEIMTFTGLGDFGAKKIKEKSDFLSKLDIEKEQGVRITRQLTSNRALQKALENPEVKNAIMDVIESSIEEILANQKKVEL